MSSNPGKGLIKNGAWVVLLSPTETDFLLKFEEKFAGQVNCFANKQSGCII